MANAFPTRSDCPEIPSTEAVEGSLIFGCTIRPPPPPIYEFPYREFPLPTPPGFDFGCYQPSVSVDFEIPVASSSVIYDPSTSSSIGEVITLPTPKFEVTIEYPDESDTGNCQPLFKFDVRFPTAFAVCPEFETSTDLRWTKETTEVDLTAERDEESGADCKFDFNLNLALACAKFETPTVSIIMIGAGSEPSGSMSISLISSSSSSGEGGEGGEDDTGEEQCKYKFDLKLWIPVSSSEPIGSNVGLHACGAYEPLWASLNNSSDFHETPEGLLLPGNAGDLGQATDTCFGPEPSLSVTVEGGEDTFTVVDARYKNPNWKIDQGFDEGLFPVLADTRLIVLDEGGKTEHALTTYGYTLQLPYFHFEEVAGGAFDLEEFIGECDQVPLVMTKMTGVDAANTGVHLTFSLSPVRMYSPEARETLVNKCFQFNTPHCYEFCVITDVSFYKAVIPSQINAGCNTFEYVLDIERDSFVMPHPELFKNGVWVGGAGPGGPPVETELECDGGQFKVITDVGLVPATPGADGACPRGTAYQFDFEFTNFTMKCDEGGALTPEFEKHSETVPEACCVAFPFVRELTSFTVVPGAAPEDPSKLVLAYTAGTIRLPEVTLDDPVNKPSSVSCEGGLWAFNALVGVNLENDPECPPCGKTLAPVVGEFELYWPSPLNEVYGKDFDLLGAADECEEMWVVVGDETTGGILLETPEDTCGYRLSYSIKKLRLPYIKRAVEQDDVPVVTPVACDNNIWEFVAVTGLHLEEGADTTAPQCTPTIIKDKDIVLEFKKFQLQFPAITVGPFTPATETITGAVPSWVSLTDIRLDATTGCGSTLVAEETTFELPYDVNTTVIEAGGPEEVQCDDGIFETLDFDGTKLERYPTSLGVELILKKKTYQIKCDTGETSGHTGTVTVVCCVKCESGNIDVYCHDLTFLDGLLQDPLGGCTPCSGGDC